MSVTAQQVYEYALALMDELDENGEVSAAGDETYKGIAPRFIDMLQRDLALPEGIPVASRIDALNDTLCISDDMAFRIMPWGLAAQLALANNDSKYNEFQNEYLRRTSKTTEGDIVDTLGAATIGSSLITGVSSVNGQTGDVNLSAENVDAVPVTRRICGKALNDDIALNAADVGLGNVLNTAQVPASYLDTDATLFANSDSKVATQKAVKAYVDENASAAVVSDTLPIGTIMEWPSDTAPVNYLLCDGQAVSRTTYSLLFSKIGTLYGGGDGATTFNVPNIKGRAAVGKDASQTEFDTLGETGGEKAHTLTVAEIPAHQHSTLIKPQQVIDVTPGTSGYNCSSDGAELTGAAGGGGAHNNLQPYIVLNYIIKALNAVPSERVDTDGTLFSNSDENVPSQKAVKSYVDNAVKFIGCSVYHNAYQTIPTNTSMGTAVILNSGYFDTDGMHDNSTNNSRITFKTAGYYLVVFQTAWASNATGAREMWLQGVIGGSSYTSLGDTRQGAPIGRDTGQMIAEIVYASVDDYLEPWVWQGSGGDLTMYYARFKAVKIG